MLVCKYCNQEFERKSKCGPEPQFCCRQHQWKYFYITHKQQKNDYNKSRYIPHPRIKKSPEEIAEYARQNSKRRYQEYKDYYKQKNHEWYIAHKEDPKNRERIRKNMRNYYYHRKLREENTDE